MQYLEKRIFIWQIHQWNNSSFLFVKRKQWKKQYTLQASKTSLSVLNDITSTPTIGAHDLRVMTLRTNGSLSPCKVTRLATYREKIAISDFFLYFVFNKQTDQYYIRKLANFYVYYMIMSNLDDRIMARLRKMTFTASTFNVKTQYAKWSHLWKFSFWSVADQFWVSKTVVKERFIRKKASLSAQ